MKVLLVHGTNLVSGGEAVSLGIAKTLGKHNFVFFLPGKPGDENLFLTFGVYYPYRRGLVRLIRRLIEVMRKEKPDIVHAQGLRAAALVKVAYYLSGKKGKFIYTLHGIHFIRKQLPARVAFLLFEKVTNKLVDALVCVGRDDFELAKTLHLVSSEKLFLIRNGINLRDVKNTRSGHVETGSCKEDQVVITTVCRLHHQKDVGSLIEAVSMLRENGVMLLIVGDGPERSQLEMLSASLCLDGRINFLGNRSDVDQILSITDIFVLSTHWEGLPLVVLEAWAHKKPVIASKVHGVKDLINDGDNGLLFDESAPRDLSEKIISILKNRDLGVRLGENGYHLVKAQYALEIMAKNYDALYAKILCSSDR